MKDPDKLSLRKELLIALFLFLMFLCILIFSASGTHIIYGQF